MIRETTKKIQCTMVWMQDVLVTDFNHLDPGGMRRNPILTTHTCRKHVAVSTASPRTTGRCAPGRPTLKRLS